MKKLCMIPVEWEQESGKICKLKSTVEKLNIAYVRKEGKKYFNSHGHVFKNEEEKKFGYNSLEEAKKAVGEHFKALHIESRVNNMEVPPHV